MLNFYKIKNKIIIKQNQNKKKQKKQYKLNIQMGVRQQVYLYIPNIIDYGRVITLLMVCYYCDTMPIFTIFLYAISQGLDAIDGLAARKFDQCNEFGKVLDMVCDRASDAVFLSILSGLFPSLRFFFLVALIIDLVSHWYQTYSTQYCQEEHHKTAKSEWRIMQIYYGSKPVLFWMVFGYEAFLLNMYLKAFEHSIELPDYFKNINTMCLFITTPIFLLKNYISIIQLISSSSKIIDAEDSYKKQQKKIQAK
ncbi:hypothetical protein PPERSA_05807 [Pseudocohnilembus persalinus]|uniref:CDP-diacylglycerol--inositol 3-phosphatidyltransferase n=1 Tax=Pseudocohnilembus persalinus TaxID=266149 RepID=A0A0V0R0A9_PSEPJ|nr:hypothetical protein PPERSA_05807 [Pseudocohnilembus persalinus]|eukprot:KRX07744.1 hypothetical protein PPERSA_05807 [Pseudocohnilembus persalinus]